MLQFYGNGSINENSDSSFLGTVYTPMRMIYTVDLNFRCDQISVNLTTIFIILYYFILFCMYVCIYVFIKNVVS